MVQRIVDWCILITFTKLDHDYLTMENVVDATEKFRHLVDRSPIVSVTLTTIHSVVYVPRYAQ